MPAIPTKLGSSVQKRTRSFAPKVVTGVRNTSSSCQSPFARITPSAIETVLIRKLLTPRSSSALLASEYPVVASYLRHACHSCRFCRGQKASLKSQTEISGSGNVNGYMGDLETSTSGLAIIFANHFEDTAYVPSWLLRAVEPFFPQSDPLS